MAIYSMNINIISRGKGKSAVSAAAYRAGDVIKNDYDGVIHDYSRKKGVVYDAMFFPANAPTEYYDRATLWNAVEKIEKAKNAQLAREVRLALPAELSLEQNTALVHDYVTDNFVCHGMIADVCLHDKGDGNPHAHIMLTMRPLEQDGTWAAKSKMEYILDGHGERIKLPSGRYKTRKVNATDWDDRGKAEEWRAAWADAVNQRLEAAGHESRVDHRSYERQGVEQIPTIHLGVAAHDMEKRGIPTERGDMNRKIKEANADIKDLNNQIHEILYPPPPQMIIDLENSIKAQGSPGYANWCKVFNLKQAAQTLIYLQENGLMDLDVLQSAYQNAKADHADILKQLNANKAEIKNLTVLRTQTENYRNTLDIFKQYNAPWRVGRFKTEFYSQHKADIEKFKKAKAYIFDELKLDKFPSLKKLSGDISGLYEKNKGLQPSLKAAQQKVKALTNVEHNIRMLLGYRELESQGYAPTTPENDLRFTKPYESSFAEANKAGATEAYFQSCYMDHDCAEDIYRASSNMANHQSAAEAILTKYGKERAERVVAAMVNNAPADKYADHRDWASQKAAGLSLEASARNTEIFHRHKDINIFDAFVQTFRRVADSMINALFTVIGADGQKISKLGWAHPKEIAKSAPQDKNWDSGLSLKDRLAVAEQLAKEHNRNTKQSASRKNNRTGLGL